jgi:hypothetical protein
MPSPEVLVVLKFLSAVSPWRRPSDRKKDAADLIGLYQTLGVDFDRQVAQQHAASIYPGAEKELAEIFNQIDRGEPVSL